MSIAQPKKFKKSEILIRLPEIPGWSYSASKLKKEFQFKDFKQAMAFMNKIAKTCEKINHHPDWKNTYSKVEVKLSTHDIGGISDKDFYLASEMNKAFIPHSVKNS